MKSSDYKVLRDLGRVSVVGITLFVCTVIGYIIGNFLDKVFHTQPYLMIIFVTLGIIAGFLELWQVAKKVSGR